jgi:alcohol dehydrogenase
VVRSLTDGLGADVAFEAVGQPETFELAVNLARPGARIANIGVHGKPAALHLEDQWIRDITVTTGLVDTYSTPTLLPLVASGQLEPAKLVTHRLGFDDFDEAYEVFSHAADSGALKVVLTA